MAGSYAMINLSAPDAAAALLRRVPPRQPLLDGRGGSRVSDSACGMV